MKALKFSSDQVDGIINGEYYCTWRLFDDKDLNVDDQLEFINSDTKKIFGYAVITKITIKKISDINEIDKQGHKSYDNLESILSDFRKYYGGSINLDSIVKVVYYQFTQKPFEKTVENNTTKYKEVKIFTDGGSRGNPGPSAGAYVVFDMQDNVVKIDGEYIGITTNNQAEYHAVKCALSYARTINSEVVHVYMDSLLVVNQMNGVFKIRNRDLWPIYQEIISLKQFFKNISFTHVPREMNKVADQKVNEILDEN